MAKKAPTLYVCKNPGCPLGSLEQLGRFTGGMSAQHKHLLTGRPLESLEEGVDYGEGLCTNCGQPGEPWDPEKAVKGALAEAKARHAAELAAIKEGVS